jgi:hypothetical protein
MGGLSVMLVVVSLLCLLGGVASLSQATMGVGGIATACFLAILARIAQASAHNDQLKQGALEQRTTAQPSVPTA